jgi:hypothetical protein
MKKQEIEKSIHDIAYQEINYNRSVINQLLYFAMLIIAAYFWLILNIGDKSIIGFNAAELIMYLSLSVLLVVGAIGLSISKQLQQENIQWIIINEVESAIKNKGLRYDTYNKYPKLYSKILLTIFCFLCLINAAIFNRCLIIACGIRFWSILIPFIIYMLIVVYGVFFYKIGIKTDVTAKAK